MALIENEDEFIKEQSEYLREVTKCFRGIDRPLKGGPTVKSLNDLIEKLHDAFSTTIVDLELVNHLMLSYKSNPKDWQRYAKWDRYKYTRNLVDAGNGNFNLMILCWGEGQASAIHDHANSNCFMKMLQGELYEVRYDMPKEEIQNENITPDINNSCLEECNFTEIKEQERFKLETNGVCYINDNIGLHRVENPSHTDGAVSLHLYCPPFSCCSVFQKNSGKKIICPVTFWSKYGIKTDKVYLKRTFDKYKS